VCVCVDGRGGGSKSTVHRKKAVNHVVVCTATCTSSKERTATHE